MKRKNIGLSHNDYFQKAFQRMEIAESFFREYLPEELISDVDWTALKLAPYEFVGKALRNRRSDVLYEVKLAGRDALFYIHLEHQRTPQKDMPVRMLFYTVHIWEQYQEQTPNCKDLPLIYPLVVYQGKKRWNAALNVHDYLQVPGYLLPFPHRNQSGVQHTVGVAPFVVEPG